MRQIGLCITLLAAGFVLGSAWGCVDSSQGLQPVDTQKVEALRTELAKAGDAGETDSTDPSLSPTGWATLKGTIKVDGTPPANPMLSITGNDRALCAPGGRNVPNELVVVGPDGGLANVIVFARRVPDKWVHEDAKEAPSEPLVFDQKECLFLDRAVPVHANRQIVIKNSDPTVHNTNIEGVANLTVSENSSIDFDFRGKTRNAPVEVKCNVHPWMISYMLPLKDNYFAVTGKDGKFEIPNLPAGVPLEFQVWQERVGGLDGGKYDNPNVEWKNRGRFIATLTPDKDEVLDLTVPASVFPAS